MTRRNRSHRLVLSSLSGERSHRFHILCLILIMRTSGVVLVCIPGFDQKPFAAELKSRPLHNSETIDPVAFGITLSIRKTPPESRLRQISTLGPDPLLSRP